MQRVTNVGLEIQEKLPPLRRSSAYNRKRMHSRRHYSSTLPRRHELTSAIIIIIIIQTRNNLVADTCYPHLYQTRGVQLLLSYRINLLRSTNAVHRTGRIFLGSYVSRARAWSRACRGGRTRSPGRPHPALHTRIRHAGTRRT